MSDFNITAPRLPSTVSATTSTAITATVPDPPRNFANLDNGTILRGTVQGRDKDGLLAIKTDQGLLSVATNANLQPGSQVTLEVRAVGDRLQVVVLAADASGQPPVSPASVPQSPQPPSPAQGDPPPRSQPGQGAQQPALSQLSGADGNVPVATSAGSGAAPATVEANPPRPIVVVAGSTLTAVVVQALPKDLLSLIDTEESLPDSMSRPVVTLPAPSTSWPSNSTTISSPVLTTLPGPSLIPEIRDKLEALFFGDGALELETGMTPRPGTPSGPNTTTTIVTTGSVTASLTTGAPMTSSLTPSSLSILNSSGLQPQTVRPVQAGTPTGQVATAQSGAGMVNTGLMNSGLLSAAAGTSPARGTPTQAAINLLTGTLSQAAGQATGSQVVEQSPGTALAFDTSLASGTEVKLQVLGIQNHPGETLDLPAMGASGKSAILGQIVGHTPSGRPVIHTPVGDLVLHQKMTLPTGAKILMALEMVDSSPALAMAQPAMTPQLTAFNLARGWPSLAELLMLLQPAGEDEGGIGKALPDIAASLNLAQPGPRLGADLATAMDAFRAGNFEKMFGSLGETLKAVGNRTDALRKLRDEFQQASLLAQGSNAQDWRCFFLPLWDDGQLQQINLFYRRPRRGKNDEDKEDNGTRFVVEVNFTRLGSCQLDGLIGKGRFDLMVRSHRDLPETARREISGLFAQAREIGNYAGELSFQTASRFPVSPLEDVAQVPPGVVA
ncbi:hypothetical protein ACFPL7_06710 [Dongia soli]|uniref:Hook-length control protein FliK n=1 Tax=Dongia soli TaxID=600628 RepID=A0ABU5E8I0_9PROT|nr:hypothetical protein [Dongia soli]MDY0882631.1 hypothetical protein [Dongia soli]